ncbi:MAG: circadian clock KaiB family protein [Cyanobacteria bacterium J06635_15]
MNLDAAPLHLPQTFKGIALFTPGGDLVYAIDVKKQARWHLHLCATLQEVFDLSESPHFLVPCYTATIDRWLDSQTHTIYTAAEAYPPVLRHQAILSAVFGVESTTWKPLYAEAELCDPWMLRTYQPQFAPLWERHDLVMQVTATGYPAKLALSTAKTDLPEPSGLKPASGFVFRLYVSGQGAATAKILATLHQLFEQFLHQPYTLKMVDVGKHPEQAETDQILATPTLIRIWPQPVRRVVGDVTNLQVLLQTLVEEDAGE